MDDTALPYRLLGHKQGIDVITLEGFDGGIDDPLAASIKLDNLVRIWVVASADRDAWGATMEATFRDIVRHTAATYAGLPATGILTVQFHAQQAEIEGDITARDEPVIRLA